MFNPPKPSFVISQYDFLLVWFGTTNQFLVVQGELEVFFKKSLGMTDYDYKGAIEELISVYPEITGLMESISEDNTNYLGGDTYEIDYKSLPLNNFEFSCFTIGQNRLSVYYSSKELQTLFEAPFAYLKISDNKNNEELTIIEKNNRLSLIRNKKHVYSTPKDKFFVLQAQFANQLTEYYNSIEIPRWLCSFHGCAVQKNNKTYLLLGDSGAGKSTLTSLLSFSDYRFIADDLVLMDHDFKIYDNPAAISIKENAWPVIESHQKLFGTLKTSEKTKGEIKMKFLPMHLLQNNKPQSFNLDAFLWVHYSKDEINCLKPLGKKETLYRLIPDTWINPELASANAFAHWVMDIKAYHLDYHDFKTAKKLIDAQIQ